MSYIDIYRDINKEKFEREDFLRDQRERLKKELSIDDMIKIMFKDFINSQHLNDIGNIAECYLKER